MMANMIVSQWKIGLVTGSKINTLKNRSVNRRWKHFARWYNSSCGSGYLEVIINNFFSDKTILREALVYITCLLRLVVYSVYFNNIVHILYYSTLKTIQFINSWLINSYFNNIVLNSYYFLIINWEYKNDFKDFLNIIYEHKCMGTYDIVCIQFSGLKTMKT